MPWLRVSDDFMQHPKVVGLSARAVALWLEAMCYVARHLTDGHDTPKVLATLRFRAAAPELREAGLWEVDGVQGDLIHDYHHYQPTREEVKGKRADLSEKRRAAGRRGAERRWQQDGKAEGKLLSGVDSKPMAPSQTHPKPVPEKQERESAPAAPPPADTPALMGRRNEHARHALCGTPCLPDSMWREMVVAKGGDEAYVTAYVQRVWASLAGQPVPLDKFKFWRERWDADHRTQRPGKATVRALPSGGAWLCPHTPRCTRRWDCHRKQQVAQMEAT